MLYVKKTNTEGCTFLGKGIKGHPEMGVVVDCRVVCLDEMDIYKNWKNNEVSVILVRTSTGYAFDASKLRDRTYEIEEYAPNSHRQWRDAWGTFG